MKKIFIGIIFLFVVAAGRSTAYAEVMVETPGVIVNTTAEFSGVKVTLDDNSILLLKHLPVTISNENSNEDILYLPLEDTLKALGYGVIRNEAGDCIKLDSCPEEKKTLTVFLENNIVTPDIKNLTVILSNPTDNEVSYGVDYHLDIKIGDKWEKLPYTGPSYFYAVAYYLSPNSLSKTYVDIERHYGQLNPGLYRLVKEFSREDYFLEFEVREYISEDIVSAEAADVKIELDGSLVALNEKFLSVTKRYETEAVLYMHWEELIKSLGINASLNGEQSAVELKSGNQSSPAVVMSVREKKITTQTEDMTFDVTYYTESVYCTIDGFYSPGRGLFGGSAFYLEKKTDGKWEKLPDRSEGGDLYGSYGTADGEYTVHYNIDIFKHYEHLSPGKHRIVKSYCTLYVETFYYAEFDVFEKN